jgi:hypothetical protein
MTALDPATVAVEISGGPLLPEYHWAQTYQTVSDADGYFRLPPIHRLAQLELHATHPAEAIPLNRPLALDFGRTDLVIDLVFP